jgi:RHH-type transcriptional regulator, proline utilization regulon repressor / proline dehydrogenase / delta 1-pyrroline-5-carboxylate dehydrogenase
MSLQDARSAVSKNYFVDEASLVRQLMDQSQLDTQARTRISDAAEEIVLALRDSQKSNLMESFLAEYGLSTHEGIALMCLAEAYLRVPDAPTMDALIRDKIGGADWSRHAGEAESLMVNASTWALMLTGKVFANEDAGARELLHGNLRRMVQRLGEPVVRTAVTQAMKVMGLQFVLGRTIEEAIERGMTMHAKGYRYSFDMLGEAARTDEDARQYLLSYSKAITVIAGYAGSKFVHDNPGISVKLSALHPRYEWTQRERVMAELVPRLSALSQLARTANIGFNIDAEEADRLELSMDVIEAVLKNPDLAGWDGFGIVVQAYSKQSMAVLAWIRSLADTYQRKLSVRLVKGAYWDMEIKNAQVQGLPVYPVFTRKSSTDVSYMAGTRYLLDNADVLYPQFATHNAHTACAVLEMAGDFDGFEFQLLHGMGEGLHEMLRMAHGRRCRVYAPVGVHQDLLAYLVRRLLENGANSSFVHQLMDEDVPAVELVGDPVNTTQALENIAHPLIPIPVDLFEDRRNAKGWNINNPAMSQGIADAMVPFEKMEWRAAPIVGGEKLESKAEQVMNPAHHEEAVGHVTWADSGSVEQALAITSDAFSNWSATDVEQRARILERSADLFEEHAAELMAILTREAGKTRLDGVLEVREAVDFLRYYALNARCQFAGEKRKGRGVFVCISPWNFPLAIFTGQIAAALVSGNTVIAKPAEQTPLIGARAVELMFEAGLNKDVLAFLPGDGATVGGPLTSDKRTAGVSFTGSTETAIIIDRAMAANCDPDAPLIAETGGLNAMIVDSTALPEHAVQDIVNSAFQSAGQRCSALRVLYVQNDIKDHLLEMLQGALMELRIGFPWNPATDVGPVIDLKSQNIITTHCKKWKKQGRELFRHDQIQDESTGHFVYPTAISLNDISELEQEIFGPVLHVIGFEQHALNDVIQQINDSGYGLTFGIHSRIDDRVENICSRVKVGNIYVNRNQIGAVVGVQPFGGEGLSGTGPKAGGPNYLTRFSLPSGGHKSREPNLYVTGKVKITRDLSVFVTQAKRHLQDWDLSNERLDILKRGIEMLPGAMQEQAIDVLDECRPFNCVAQPFAGPTGESNHLTYHGRGIALCLGEDVVRQTIAALALGNAIVLCEGDKPETSGAILIDAFCKAEVPSQLMAAIQSDDIETTVRTFPDLALVALDGDENRTMIRRALATRDGARVSLIGSDDSLVRYACERVVSIDTTASGGNATLLTLEEG